MKSMQTSRKPSSRTGVDLRDTALEAHESRNQALILRGRRALLLAALGRPTQTCTADDVRDRVALPAGVSPTVFGSVTPSLARLGLLRKCGWGSSARREAHARLLPVWQIVDAAAARKWLAMNPEPPPDREPDPPWSPPDGYEKTRSGADAERAKPKNEDCGGEATSGDILPASVSNQSDAPVQVGDYRPTQHLTGERRQATFLDAVEFIGAAAPSLQYGSDIPTGLGGASNREGSTLASSYRMPAGRHKGKSLLEVAERDEQYLTWLANVERPYGWTEVAQFAVRQFLRARAGRSA